MRQIILTPKDVFRGPLILVNASYPLRHTFPAELTPTNSRDVLLDNKAATMLSQLLCTIKSEDDIIVVSGYRTRTEQEQIYQTSLFENGETFTKSYVALPDRSEHQTGLAVDLAIAAPEIDFIRPHFPLDGICGDFRTLSPRYGFVERYAKEKETITGIAYEPWHFRYVGFPHSQLMVRWGLCLEEYIDTLRNFSHTPLSLEEEGRNIQISYFPIKKETTTIELPEKTLFQLSGNNVDGVVLTVWEGVI